MKSITILGAGIAGLTAAICLKNYDPKLKVAVFEKNSDVGLSHNNDFQQLDNWVEEKDVLEQIVEDTGLNIRLAVIKPFYGMTTFSPKGKKFELKSKKPLFYTVKRGSRHSLDDYLRNLAIEKKVNIFYNAKISEEWVDIVASGAKKVYGLASGYKFYTDLPDGITGFLDDNIAHKGYAYLVVINGEATLATVLGKNFSEAKEYRNKALGKFKRFLGDFKTENMKPFSGFDAYKNLKSRKKGNRLYVGSAGGFQDPLFGFGMRQAMISGSLAAKSLYENKDYDVLWKERLSNEHKNEMVMKMIFNQMGNAGYEIMVGIIRKVQQIVDPDLWHFMHISYSFPLVRHPLTPIAERYCKEIFEGFTEF